MRFDRGQELKAVIFAGGHGTRLAEATNITPKPLLEIGGLPILLHIMRIYSSYGVNEFVVLVGYKGHLIKEYFINYLAHVQDVVVDVGKSEVMFLNTSRPRPSWKVTVIDTGVETMTGGRLARARSILEGESHFALTYGDGVADIDIRALEKFHLSHGKIATVTAVSPPGRFGAMEIEGESVLRFMEKPKGDGAFINGGFFILDSRVFNHLGNDECVFEQEPLQVLAELGELKAYRHTGFWQCMDTLRDKQFLDALCSRGTAPWLKDEMSGI